MTVPTTRICAAEGEPSSVAFASCSVLVPQSNVMCMTCRSTQNHPSSRCVATATYPRNPMSPSGASRAPATGRHQAVKGWCSRTARITAAAAAVSTARMSATAVLRTVPAARVSSPAVSHCLLARASRAQMARAQKSASA